VKVDWQRNVYNVNHLLTQVGGLYASLVGAFYVLSSFFNRHILVGKLISELYYVR